MRRKWYVMASILFYLLFLVSAWEFDIRKLIDVTLLFQLFVGTLILSVPFCQKGTKKRELSVIFGRKALDAGYIQTFLLLFIRMSGEKGYEDLLGDVAMSFRPVLYGFCLYLLLSSKDEDRAGDGTENRKKQKREEA